MHKPILVTCPRLKTGHAHSPAIMASLEEHSPWGMVMGDAGLHHHPTEYATWHIRTDEGETSTSYDPSIHHHVLSEPATVVCPAFLAAMDDVVEATQNCQRPHDFGATNSMVYISSNRYVLFSSNSSIGCHFTKCYRFWEAYVAQSSSLNAPS